MSIRRTQLPAAVVRRVTQEVAAERDLGEYEIMSESRRKPVARARQLVMYRLREIRRGDDPAYGWVSIGGAFGCDHTTAMHAYKRVVERGEA
jgi:chromosomal replication initiation ATPase DnaA